MSGDLFAARVEGALRREEERQSQPPAPLRDRVSVAPVVASVVMPR